MESSMDTAVEVISHSYTLHRQVYFDLHHREIRLVTLLPGQWSDKIQCQLKHAPLANNPVYKALSYVWGSPRATRTVLVDGHHYSVTVNLESALRRLRKPDGYLIIWIDALCINQSNNQERTEQVNLMHDIYASAEEVIVYLGEVQRYDKPASFQNTVFYYDDRDLENLQAFHVSCLPKVSSANRKRKQKLDFEVQVFCLLRILALEPNLDHFPVFDSQGHSLDEKFQCDIFEGLRQLLLARWWNRIWVIQEVVVPRTIMMVYGSAFAPWSMFVNAAKWSSPQSHTSPHAFPAECFSVLAYFSRKILDIDQRRQSWRTGKRTGLLPLLRRFSGRKASDDRDKVYALLSLSCTSMAPDYSLDVATVYKKTVLDIIKSTSSLTALAGELGRKDRQDLPSWVPDWSATYDDLDRRRADSSEDYNASGETKVYVQDYGAEPSSGMLKYFGWSFEDGPTLLKTLNEVMQTRKWMEWLPDNSPHPSKEICLTAINDYLTAQGSLVCLEDHGEGVIGLPGICLDKISFVGQTALSEEGLRPVVRSWASMLDRLSLNVFDKVHSRRDLAENFRRTICADRVWDTSGSPDSTSRPINKDDHDMITAWFLKGTSETERLLYQGFADFNVLEGEEAQSSVIDSAIQLATFRRALFVTEGGRLGLGPSKLRAGDCVYYLLGGQTPFILRQSHICRILRVSSYPRLGYVGRQCFEMVGDAYVHGFMDGEAVQEWRNASAAVNMEDNRVRGLLRQWQASFRSWEKASNDITPWKLAIGDETVRRQANRRGLDLTEEDWEEYKLWEASEKYQKLATAKTHDFRVWQDEFYQMANKKWTMALIMAAKAKIEEVEKNIARFELEMDAVMELISEAEGRVNQSRYIHLA